MQPRTKGSSLAAQRIAQHKPDPATLRSINGLKHAIPVGNRLCQVKENYHLEKERIRRLKEIKPQIDAKAPKVCGMAHLKTNWSRAEKEACRFDAIESENLRLMRAIKDVVKEHSLASPARVQSKSTSSLPSHSAFNFPGGPARRNEIIRIEKENMKLLQRLQDIAPEYKTSSWEASHDQHRQIMRRICQYPLPKMKKRMTPTASLTKLTSEDDDLLHGETAIDSDAVASESLSGPPSLQYVLTQQRLIGDSPFYVEMATDGRALAVSAYSREAQDTLELLVNEEKHYLLRQETGGDYALLADRLRVLPEGQLIIAEAEHVHDLSAIPNASIMPETTYVDFTRTSPETTTADV
jgi:hypothetical protein